MQKNEEFQGDDMKCILKWYNSRTNRLRVSVIWAISIVGFISTVMTILGVSVNGWVNNIGLSLLIVAGVLCGTYCGAFCIIGKIYKDSVSMTIRQTPVSITCGDIFETEGWKVIGCDTHFYTRIDDVVISKKSLHGKFVLEHGDADEIEVRVKEEAARLGLTANSDGLYDFQPGTIIRYESRKDKKTYLMLAMTKLNNNYESHTNMAEYEHMLMRMWAEIDRVYASNDIVLPLLGSGISRFDDGPKDNEAFLRCMLCTLNSSGVSLNSKVKIVVYGDANDIPFYEYKAMFRTVQGK